MWVMCARISSCLVFCYGIGESVRQEVARGWLMISPTITDVHGGLWEFKVSQSSFHLILTEQGHILILHFEGERPGLMSFSNLTKVTSKEEVELGGTQAPSAPPCQGVWTGFLRPCVFACPSCPHSFTFCYKSLISHKRTSTFSILPFPITESLSWCVF